MRPTVPTATLRGRQIGRCAPATSRTRTAPGARPGRPQERCRGGLCEGRRSPGRFAVAAARSKRGVGGPSEGATPPTRSQDAGATLEGRGPQGCVVAEGHPHPAGAGSWAAKEEAGAETHWRRRSASGSPPRPSPQCRGAGRQKPDGGAAKGKTYNSGYSHVVTHRTTSPPVRSLSSGERTGSSVLCDLWSYVLGGGPRELIVPRGGARSGAALDA